MISFISWTLLIFKYPLHVIQNNCSNLTISRLLDSQNEIQLFIYIFGQSFFTFILHILSDHSYGILKPAVEYKINKNACSKREKQRDVVCPWSIWLIGCRPCPTLLRIKYIKVQGSCCWMFSCFHANRWILKMKSRFSLNSELPTSPTFQTHSSSSLSCLPPSVYSGIHQRHYCHARQISSREMRNSSHFKVQAKG